MGRALLSSMDEENALAVIRASTEQIANLFDYMIVAVGADEIGHAEVTADSLLVRDDIYAHDS